MSTPNPRLNDPEATRPGSSTHEVLRAVSAAHTALAIAFRDIVRCYESSGYAACTPLLVDFERELRAYLVGEHAELSARLAEVFEADVERAQQLRDQRTRLRRVVQTIRDLAELQSGLPPDSPCAPNFGLAFASLERHLGESFARIERDFVPLYCARVGHDGSRERAIVA